MSGSSNFDVEKEEMMPTRDLLFNVSNSQSTLAGEGNRLANSVILEKHIKALSDKLNRDYLMIKVLKPLLLLVMVGLIFSYFLFSALSMLLVGATGLFCLMMLDDPMIRYSSAFKKEKVMGDLLGSKLFDALSSVRPSNGENKLSDANINLNALLVISQNDLVNISTKILFEKINKTEKAVFISNPEYSAIKVKSNAIKKVFNRILRIYVWKLARLKREDLSGVNVYVNFRKDLKIEEAINDGKFEEFRLKVLKYSGSMKIYQKYSQMLNNHKKLKKEQEQALLNSRKVLVGTELTENDKFFKDVLGDSGENLNKQFFEKGIK